MTHFEVGINNQALLWRRHFLSELCEPEIRSLIDEPILNPPTEIAKTPFEVVRDRGVSWRWNGWHRAELKLWDADNNAQSRNFDADDAAEVYFTDCSNAVQIELSLYDGGGRATAIKLALPIILRVGAIEITEVPRGAYGKAILVRVTDRMKINGLQVEKLLPRDPFYPDGKFAFEPPNSQIFVPVRQPDFGIFEPFFLVVSVQTEEGRKMLRCASVNFDGRLSFEPEIPKEQLDNLRLWTEGENSGETRHRAPTFTDWLDTWTEFSRQKLVELKRLYQTSSKISESTAESHLQAYPTGLTRCLILKSLGCNWVAENWNRYLKLLNQNSFYDAVKESNPVLSGVFDRLPDDLEVLLWSLKNARHPSLVDAVRSTVETGIKGLQRELHLLEMRAAGIAARNEKRKKKTV